MYTLRRISSDGVEMNHSLGHQYTVIDKIHNKKEFEITVKLSEFYENDDIYKFVCGRGGEYIQPLFKNQQAYIMTDSGKTFDNLSFKG